MYIDRAKIIVIKIGSSNLVDNKGRLKEKWLKSFVNDIKKFKEKGKDFVIVSSGAIALGQNYLKVKRKKLKIEMSQALASIGQIHLTNIYRKMFEKNKIRIGQILISPDDTEQRRRAINIKRTFENLFKLGAIPIVNENDTTATSEIKYGDNDRLAARVAQIISANVLVNFSDVDGLYQSSKSKKIIKEVKDINEKIYSFVNNKRSSYGSGGMPTKLEAAKICMNSGCFMAIANGKFVNPFDRLIKKNICTWFLPKVSSLDARKKWIVSSIGSNGKIYIDNGASKALDNGKSLLPAGITKVDGKFLKGDNILIVDDNGKSIARGLTSFSSIEIDKIKGLKSDQIENILGYSSKSEIIHRDDMVKL
ncbi:MAG: glutamate 5-kinase [Candidatus Marinimicrobia bacterium]|nr:glutamate 5-kinase [Candidatus Neomarinimicrobiota bacterium]RPG04846.1 MAG: glutamate 5-kinase [Pelagibacteraceae bacterium TMED247]|tara:strand:+ start:4267 stop:5361 length:1095 start_codon:yes stop_codon:yes gene_type:complete